MPTASLAYPKSRVSLLPVVDLGNREERERLSRAALEGFFNIMTRWKIRDEGARALLGGVSNGAYYGWKKDPQRVLDVAFPEQAHPGVDPEDVEGMVGRRPQRHRLGEEGPGAGSHPGPEALVEGGAHGRDADPVQPGAAHPVGLHHPGVKRVGEAAGRGDQLQVGIGPFEGAGHGRQLRDWGGLGGHLEQALVVRWAAVTEPVWREGEPGEEQRARGHQAC